MKYTVEHTDCGPIIAQFEYLYQAEICACAISKVHPHNKYVIKSNDRVMSRWQSSVGINELTDKRVRVVRTGSR